VISLDKLHLSRIQVSNFPLLQLRSIQAQTSATNSEESESLDAFISSARICLSQATVGQEKRQTFLFNHTRLKPLPTSMSRFSCDCQVSWLFQYYVVRSSSTIPIICEPQNWHGTLLVFANMVLVIHISGTWGAKPMPIVNNCLLVVHIFGFFTVVIVL
jgi:hypothetical protein